MNYKITIYLGVLLIAVIAAVWIATSRQSGAKKETADLFGENAPAFVAIAYTPDGQTPTLAFEKSGDKWNMTAPMKARAIDNIKSIADELRKMKFDDKYPVEPTGAHSLDYTGLKAPRDVIQLTDDAGKKHTLAIGKRNNENKYFATLQDSNTIFLLSRNPAEDFQRKASTFRSHDLIQIEKGDQAIKRVAIIRKDAATELAPEPASPTAFTRTWRIERPTPARASASAVRAIVSQIARLSAQDFTTTSRIVAGLDEPRLTVTATVEGKIEGLAADLASAGTAPSTTASTSTAPATRQITILFGSSADMENKTVFASLAGSSEVFVVSGAVFDAMNKSTDDLRDRRIFPDAVDTYGASEISLANLAANTSYKLTRTAAIGGTEDAPWSFVAAPLSGISPAATFDANIQTITSIQAALKNLNASDFLSAGDLKSLGLDPPQRTITLKLDDSGAGAPTGSPKTEELFIGNEIPPASPGAPAKTAVQRKTGGGDQPVLVVTATLADLSPTPLTLRSPLVTRFKADDVRSIEIAAKDAAKSFTLARTSAGRWEIKKPGAAPAEADVGRVTMYLAEFTPLTAKTWIRQQPDPKIETGAGDFVIKITSEEPQAVTTAPAGAPAATSPAPAATSTAPAATTPATTATPRPNLLQPDLVGPVAVKQVVQTIHLYKLPTLPKPPASAPGTAAAPTAEAAHPTWSGWIATDAPKGTDWVFEPADRLISSTIDSDFTRPLAPAPAPKPE